jgi:hypothetical protein
MKNPAALLGITLAVAAAALAAWHWRAAWLPDPAARTAQAPAAPEAAPPAPVPAAAPAPAPGVARYPIDAAASAPEIVEAPPTLEGALARLVGSEALATLVVGDDFARRVVATVDNLGREKAPARLWPLQPPAGRFTTQAQGGGAEQLAADNFVRYGRHLTFIERTDARLGVALYKRHYAQFQQAYEELGYPGRHFNDRVVEVIDLLLATPVPKDPVAVRMPVGAGPIQPERPWLIYEFADPAQQALPAGQQLLLRMGPDNARRVKARLAEVRRLLVR